MFFEFYISGILVIIVTAVITAKMVKKRENKNINKISFKESMDLAELPIITFYNNNKKLNFLLDTGCNSSCINLSLLPSLKCTPTGEFEKITGIEGNKTFTPCYKMNIVYKGVDYVEEFSALDLDSAFDTIKCESGVQIHGVLGNKFFEKYKYVLDFKDLVAYTKK